MQEQVNNMLIPYRDAGEALSPSQPNQTESQLH